jgi:peptidoglycan hydrolase CwlO-like protein
MDAWNSPSAWREKIFQRISMQLWRQVADPERNVTGLAYLIFKKSHPKADSAAFDPLTWEFQEFLTQETKAPYEREDDYICVSVATNQQSVDLDMPFRTKDAVEGSLSAHVEYKISNPLVALRATGDVVDEIKNRCRTVITDLIGFSNSSILTTNTVELELSRQALSDIGMLIVSAEISYRVIVDPPPEVSENQDKKDDDQELKLLEQEVQNFLESVDRLGSHAMDMTQNLKRQIAKFETRLETRDTQIEELNTEIAEIKNELNMARERISGQDTNIQELDSKIAIIEDQLSTAEQAISDREGQLEYLHSQVAQKEAEITGIQTALGQTSEQLTGRTHEVNRLNSEVQNISAELQRAKSRVTVLLIVLVLFFIALVGLAISRH